MTSHRRSLSQILRILTLQLGLGLAGLAPLAAQQPAAAPAQAPASAAQPAPAQPAAPPPPAPAAAAPARDAADSAKTLLDQIEARLERRLSNDELNEVRRQLDPVREALAKAVEQLQPRLAEARGRLEQLGPAPAEGAAAEGAEARALREQQTRAVAELDGLIRNLRVQLVRIDQIADRIVERRRQMFTAELLDRSTPIVDPRSWVALMEAMPRLGRSSGYLLADWQAHLTHAVGPARILVAAAIAVLAALVLFLLRRQLLRRGLYREPEHEPATQLARILAAFRVALERSLVLPLTVGVFLLILANFELVLPRAEPLVPTAVLTATLIIAVTRGIMQAVLAPGAPAYRLVPLPDAFAEAVFASVRAAAWVVAIGVVLQAYARSIIAPVTVTIFVAGATALAIIIIAFLFLRRTAQPPAADSPDAETSGATQRGSADGSVPLAWVRPALWLFVVVVLAALIAGYTALAAFIASRVAAAVVIACATVLVLQLVDALIAEWFGADTVRGRSLSVALGVRPERLDLMGTLLDGALRIAVLTASVLIVLGPWGFGGLSATLDDAFFGLRLGEVRSWALTIAAAGLVVAVGLVVVKAVLNWIRDKVLPRTGMDSGLQNSIATILGYAGFALVVALGLRQIGLDLSNVAIIAGALSVGIGFGLQSIVSNFVSGLILLAERPIRVGDSIVVKGEEGYVRKISVRSTEIETFDRATVILPNAELITGVVKNWTHSNTMGRIAIPVRVSYQTDPEVVRDELMAVACDNRFVVQNPPPRIFLMRFADFGIEFELRCIVTNVDYALTVRSDLQLAILQRFRKRGILLMPTINQRDMKPEPPEPDHPPGWRPGSRRSTS
jgi:small-conductance mechanosensitive channel